MAFARSHARALPRVSSLGFSGAGFLTCYHMGAAQCLIDRGLIKLDDDNDTSRTGGTTPPHRAASFLPVCGVSGGSLIAAALAANVHPSEGLDAVLQVSRRARNAGRMNALQPGFSLVDVMEEYLVPLLRTGDEESFLRRIEHGKRLRIGLTDTRRLSQGRENAFVYVDRYDDVDDVIAACVLSSYIPGVTGPARGSLDSRYSAVLRAMERLKDMFNRGCVKDGATHHVVHLGQSQSVREFCWDGGIANAFPYYDKDTIIITPLAVEFRDHISINPSIEQGYQKKYKSVRSVPLSSHVRLHLTPPNGLTWKHILIGPTDDELQQRFEQGYENATAFLDVQSKTMKPLEEAGDAAANSGTAATGLTNS